MSSSSANTNGTAAQQVADAATDSIAARRNADRLQALQLSEAQIELMDEDSLQEAVAIISEGMEVRQPTEQEAVTLNRLCKALEWMEDANANLAIQQEICDAAAQAIQAEQQALQDALAGEDSDDEN